LKSSTSMMVKELLLSVLEISISFATNNGVDLEVCVVGIATGPKARAAGAVARTRASAEIFILRTVWFVFEWELYSFLIL
jgi:hypothetical protein